MEYKNILVTGGCGFIGSNFINYFVNKYNNINCINIDKLDYCSDIRNIRVNNNNNYRFIKGNILDKQLILNILIDYDIDVIIHFAAQSHVDNSFENCGYFIKDNIEGTVSLLECSRKYNKLKKFIHISTDEVYGEMSYTNNACDVNIRLNPTNPYSASKASAEYFVLAYHKCYNIPIIITRSNNVYGPNQYPEKLISRSITKLLNNEKCIVHGKGENYRNFIYTTDKIKSIEILLKKGNIGEIYNIGTSDEFKVLDVIIKIIKKIKNTDKYNDWLEYVGERPWNDLRYNIDNLKIKQLGWKQEINFNEGLEKTIDWYINSWYNDPKILDNL